jgi:hypothetical protein
MQAEEIFMQPARAWFDRFRNAVCDMGYKQSMEIIQIVSLSWENDEVEISRPKKN